MAESVKDFCVNKLQIPSIEALETFKKWYNAKKENKVEEMIDAVEETIGESQSPRGLFNQAYLFYAKGRANNKQEKLENKALYLNKVKSILDNCIVNHAMSKEEFYKICINSYFFFRACVSKRGELVETSTSKMININQRKAVVRKAA